MSIRVDRRTMGEMDAEGSERFKSVPLVSCDPEMFDDFFDSVDSFVKGICNDGEISPDPYMFMFKKESEEMGIGITSQLNRSNAIAWGMIDESEEYQGIPDGYTLAKIIMNEYKPHAVAIVSAFTDDTKGPDIGGVSIHGVSFDRKWGDKKCYKAKLDMDENNGIQKWNLTETQKNIVPDLDDAIAKNIFHVCENCGGDGC